MVQGFDVDFGGVWCQGFYLVSKEMVCVYVSVFGQGLWGCIIFIFIFSYGLKKMKMKMLMVEF